MLSEVATTLLIQESIMLPVYLKVTPFITLEWMCEMDQADLGWMEDIVKYLRTREVSKDGKQANKLRIEAAHYTLINDQLYKRSFGGPYLRCLNEMKTQYILAELHEGVCGNHPSRRTLVQKA